MKWTSSSRRRAVCAALGLVLAASGAQAADSEPPQHGACSPQGQRRDSADVNAVRLANGPVLPLYRGTGRLPIAFEAAGETVHAYDAQGERLWSRKIGTGALFGGFDLDGDGIVDFGLAKRRSLNRSCGISVVHDSWLEFYAGTNGRRLGETAPITDICHQNLNYATQQWAHNTVLFGKRPGLVAIAPQFATTGWFFYMTPAGIRQHSYYYPSTPSFEATYKRAAKAISADGRQQPSEVARAHVQNGLILGRKGSERLVFFTTGRVSQFAVAPLSSAQLIADSRFSPGPTLTGRNYGLVQSNPWNPSRVALIAGASAYSVFADLRDGKIANDLYGGIERHVTLYDSSTNRVLQRFFSKADNATVAQAYNGRVVYPAHVFVPTGDRTEAVAYNVYNGGRWSLHMSRAGSVRDAFRSEDLFLWDVRDLDGDQVPEFITSPTQPGVGAYFPHWTTEIYSLDTETGQLRLRQRLPGAIPYLTEAFREADVTSSSGFLYPALVGVERGQSGLYVLGTDRKVAHAPICLD